MVKIVFILLLTPLYLSFSTCFEKSDSPECFLSPNPESAAAETVTGVADSFSSGPVSWRPLGVLDIELQNCKIGERKCV